MSTPRSGSAATSAIGTAAAPTVSHTWRSRGLVSPCGMLLSRIAPTRMIAILAYSDGSIWNPPGSEIQDFAPLTTLPSGVSTASRPRHDTPSTTGEAARICR